MVSSNILLAIIPTKYQIFNCIFSIYPENTKYGTISDLINVLIAKTDYANIDKITDDLTVDNLKLFNITAEQTSLVTPFQIIINPYFNKNNNILPKLLLPK